ncbi:hypothetical protein SAMN05444336_101263 [Albimonas donghaensis]|uniref:Uncharacterized protein n=1 Tax=Albimonas donghaensis TaxID=356660 RepID=A0A1H2R9T7_9RHOB|nr:hypothetical protein [Albimonas donghaensis]SDW15449.1 hypothetical protein SAMN05444336_101263 [Albimonas donghaensis]
MPTETPETITMTHCKPGDWYVCNRRMFTYKGQADASGRVVMHRLPDGDDTVH